MSEKTATASGDILWTRRDLSVLTVPYRGHMRLLQGASLADLFLPLILLRGSPGPIWRVPLSLRNVTLAEVHEAPPELSQEQITLALMKIVLAPGRVS